MFIEKTATTGDGDGNGNGDSDEDDDNEQGELCLIRNLRLYQGSSMQER